MSQDTEKLASETKHAPGPWRADWDDNGQWYIEPLGITGNALRGDSGDCVESANAHLIAAAPDLLSDSRDTLALFQRLLGNLKYVPDTDQSGHPHGYSVGQIPEWEIRQKIEWLEKSVAKAEGRL